MALEASLASLGVRMAATADVEQVVAERVIAQAEMSETAQRLAARLSKVDRQIAGVQAMLSQPSGARKLDARQAREQGMQQHRLTELLSERSAVVALQRKHEADVAKAASVTLSQAVARSSGKERVLRAFEEEEAALRAIGSAATADQGGSLGRHRLHTTSAAVSNARHAALQHSAELALDPASTSAAAASAAAADGGSGGRGAVGSSGAPLARASASAPAFAAPPPRRRRPPPPVDDIDDADDLAFAKRLARPRKRAQGADAVVAARAAAAAALEGSDEEAEAEEGAARAAVRAPAGPGRRSMEGAEGDGAEHGAGGSRGQQARADAQLRADAALARRLAREEAARPTRARRGASSGGAGGAARRSAGATVRGGADSSSEGSGDGSWRATGSSGSSSDSEGDAGVRAAGEDDEDDADDVLRHDRWNRPAAAQRGGRGGGRAARRGGGVAKRKRGAAGARRAVAESEEDEEAAEWVPGASGDEDDEASEGEGEGEGEEEEEAWLDEELPDEQVSRTLRIPGGLWAQMFEHQREGLRWLANLHEEGVGGIVGDDMGLGKTLQTVSLLAALHHSRAGGPVLVACPATILKQWVREVHRWFPPIRASILHDCSSGGRDRTLAQRLRSATTVRTRGDVCVVVTTYESIRVHVETLQKVDWQYVILDEGHKIRNPQAEVSLACKAFATPHRLILSGSPIQNNLSELWSLLDFAFPGKLGSLPVFTAQFAVPIARGSYTSASPFDVQAAYQCSLVLRDLIAPYLLRRLKGEVAAGRALPPKSEHVLFCSLTPFQTELYDRFLSSELVSATLAGRTSAFAALTALQKICNHPHLFAYTPPDSEDSAAAAGGGTRGGGSHAARNDEDAEESAAMAAIGGGRAAQRAAAAPLPAAHSAEYGDPALSGKMRVLQQVLSAWQAEGHRVLLFAQTRQMLDVLQIFARQAGYNHRRLDGSTAVGSRLALIDEFNRDASIFLMLLTTRAGGLGVNLTGADRVVLYDPDWNPANDAQARERAWRIGQLRSVTVYRLVSVGSVEEKVFHRQVFKQLLSNKILKDPKQRRLFKQTDLKDLFARPPGVGASSAPVLARAASEAAAAAEASVDGAGGRGAGAAAAPAARGAGEGMPRFDDAYTEREVVVRDAPADGVAAQRGGEGEAGSEARARGETALLKNLLEGRGVNSAINHDHVVGDECMARLTREEASKVAQRAAALIRQSGAQLSSERDPAVAAGLVARPRPAVPRFGRGPSTATPPAAPPAVTAGGALGQPARGVLSSSELLARIRGRQRDVEEAASNLSRQPESLEALAAVRPAASSDQQAAAMLSKLRHHFVRHGGKSSTAQIIDAFERQCEASNIGKVLFRELLRQVAEQDGSEWRLRRS